MKDTTDSWLSYAPSLAASETHGSACRGLSAASASRSGEMGQGSVKGGLGGWGYQDRGRAVFSPSTATCAASGSFDSLLPCSRRKRRRTDTAYRGAHAHDYIVRPDWPSVDCTAIDQCAKRSKDARLAIQRSPSLLRSPLYRSPQLTLHTPQRLSTRPSLPPEPRHRHRFSLSLSLPILFLLLPLLVLLPLATASPTPSDNDGDTMTVACADSSLSPYIPPSLLSHPFDRSSHFFSTASNLFCATRPGFIIQRVYVTGNASAVDTDPDTEVLRRVCEGTLGMVREEQEQLVRWRGLLEGVNERMGGRDVQRGSRQAGTSGIAGDDGEEEKPWAWFVDDQDSHSAVRANPGSLVLSGTKSPFARRATSSSTTSTPAPSNRAQLHRGATYSNKEGLWVVDICAIPPELLEQDELYFPPPPQQQSIGEVDAAINPDNDQTDNKEGQEDEEDKDEGAKAQEARRKERMVMMIHALEGTGLQGLSVAGSKKTSSAGRRYGVYGNGGGRGMKGKGVCTVGKVGWTVGMGTAASLALLFLGV